MLERLFKDAPEGLVEFAVAANGNEWHRRYYPPSEAPSIAERLKGRVDVYFSPALRHQPSPKKGVTGKACVGWVDYDGPSYASFVPPSYVVRTQHGYHLYYLLDAWYGPDEIEDVNKTLLAIVGGDADKACWNANRILRVPGTVHNEGRAIQVVRQGGYVYTPGELHALSGLEAKYKQKVLTGDRRGYTSRSERDFAVIAALVGAGASEDTVRAIFQEHDVGDKYREEAKEGNGEHYLMHTLANVRAVGADQTHKKERVSKADRILSAAMSGDMLLLSDERGTPYALINREGHRELWGIDSQRFSDWLAFLLYSNTGETVTPVTLNKVTQVLRSKALFEGKQVRLDNRVTRRHGALWYDLTNDAWETLRITEDGWEVHHDPPVMFRRYVHQRPQVMPRQVDEDRALNTLWRLFEFVNVRDEDSRLLFVVYLVSTFVPDIAHPIITLHGEQGTGKSFTLRILRQLVDPSAVSTLSVPWKSGEFVQQLDHHWCAYYDNISSLSDWQQDVLCRAVTGEGHTKRRLYSDDEDVIYVYRRCVGLNGITLTSSRPDVLDRSLMFELHRLEGYREREKVLLGKFHALKPGLLGASLTVLSQAMRIPEDPTIQEAMDFRLADWASWGYRIARAVGEGARFLELYGTAVKEKSMTALLLHPLGQAVYEMMSTRKEWVGTATEMLDELGAVAVDLGIDRTQREWPSGANWLGRRLREVMPDLRRMGVTLESKEVSAGTVYRLQNVGEIQPQRTTELQVGDMTIHI